MLKAEERFSLRYRGELREALNMIEGDDGEFVLIDLGTLANKTPWVMVQSCASGRSFVLVRTKPSNHKAALWHAANDAETNLVGPVISEEPTRPPSAGLRRPSMRRD
jgi:hypothetical protein